MKYNNKGYTLLQQRYIKTCNQINITPLCDLFVCTHERTDILTLMPSALLSDLYVIGESVKCEIGVIR